MFKKNNILLLGLLGFGAYYLFKLGKKKPIEDISNKDEETASGGGAISGGFQNDEEKLKQVEITVEKTKEPLKLKNFEHIKGDELLAKIQKIQEKGDVKLPTTSMGMPKVGAKKTTITPKLTTFNIQNPIEKTDVISMGKLKPMKSFYDFDADEMDNEEFIID